MRSRRKKEKDRVRREKHDIYIALMRHAFYDKTRGEVVSTLSRRDLLNLVSVQHIHLVPDVMRGEVLLDTRGCGSFQRLSLNQ